MLEPADSIRVVRVLQTPGQPVMAWVESAGSGRTARVAGKVIERQYRCGDRHLLLLTEGNPYEEALHVHYLDSELRLLDSIELSAPYTAGVLDHVAVAAANALTFAFFNAHERWRLEIADTPRWRLRGNAFPVRRKRPLFCKAWLVLEKEA
ncbi:hypothetical protein J7I44_01750 [Frateuria sp. MAH-13]|uniref:ASCH domain-containing protein n=1 Tax=Frateuria flava TaxID=2821489 RepID=A0ABS4DIY1_9GAMM|nr:hypothetical protein [Frateuria flava]MBP1473003.1 hypothetical protein [Frateuria flava]